MDNGPTSLLVNPFYAVTGIIVMVVNAAVGLGLGGLSEKAEKKD